MTQQQDSPGKDEFRPLSPSPIDPPYLVDAGAIANDQIDAKSREYPASRGNPNFYHDAYCFLLDSSFIPERVSSLPPDKSGNMLKSFRQNCVKRFRLAPKPHDLTSSRLLYFKKGRRNNLSWNYIPFVDEQVAIMEQCHLHTGKHSTLEEALQCFEQLGVWWDRGRQDICEYVQMCGCEKKKRGVWKQTGRE